MLAAFTDYQDPNLGDFAVAEFNAKPFVLEVARKLDTDDD